MAEQIKKVVSDYEMNKQIADKICDMIDNNDYESWKKCWKTSYDTNDLYWGVIDGEFASFVFHKQIFNVELYGINVEIEPDFYLNFHEIKSHKKKLSKNAKGVPTYKYAGFEKHLTIAQLSTLELLLEDYENIEDVVLKEQVSNLINCPSKPHLIEFDYEKDNGETDHFKQEIYKKKGEWLYKKSQYVLEYYFKNSDLTEPFDIKALWGVEDKKEKQEKERFENAEIVKKDYIKRANLKFHEITSDKAFYVPSEHSITIPKLEQFDSTNEYYSICFHEMAHSTGHMSLLSRNQWEHFGSTTYAREELVAELSATFTMSALKIDTEQTFRNTVSYLASWGKELREKIRHNITSTIALSQKATQLILGVEKGE